MKVLKAPILDSTFVQSLIPQASPFVMVDKLLHYSTEKIQSGLQITPNLLFIENNQFQAPGLIEHMAQTVALYTGYGYYLKEQKPPEGYIGAISKVHITQLPNIGDEITTTVDILHDIMGITLVKAEVYCNATLIASCQMKTALAK